MLEKSHSKTWSIDGFTLTATVSLCCFMYEDYGLQVSVRVQDQNGKQISDGIFHSRDVLGRGVPMAEATETDFDAICESIQLAECVVDGCKNKQIVNPRSNRKGWCEACFLAKINAEYEKAVEEDRIAMQEIDRQARAKGYRYRVDAYIHSDISDDRQIYWHTLEKPTDKQCRAVLKSQGSRVLDDFKIVPLEEEEE